MNLIRLFLVIQNAALNRVCVFLFLAIVNIPLVFADSSTETQPFEIPQGIHTATFVDDIDGISVIKFSGNYDRDDSTGKTNAAARAVVAQEFYRTHSDDYDFLVVFSDFEFDTGSALAFHLGVSNKVEGIGSPIYSNSVLFGSESELKGYIDMANIDRYETNSLNVNAGAGDDFSFTLKVLAHETLHQWGISSGIDALQEPGDSHWSFFVDTDASVQYGHDWRDNGDGTFTAEAARARYSTLDLYLMGLAKKEEVSDFFVIEPSPGTEFSKGDLPKPGVTVSGTKQNVSVDDLIGVNGVRNPSFDESQKVFRYAFIYLTSSDDSSGSATVDSDLGKIRQVRSEYEDRFSVLTGGRAIARVYPAARFNTDAEVIDDVVSDGILDGLGDGSSGKAISWLLDQQNDDGSWSDRDSTTVRDSARVLQTFNSLGAQLDSQISAKEWFENLEPENVDSLARKLLAVIEKSPQQGHEIAKALQANQNSDGGWGLTKGLDSSVIDSGLALCSLSKSNQGAASDVLASAFDFIVGAQNPDGGWGVTNKSPSSVSTTARALMALSCAEMQLDSGQQDLALSWLLTQKKIDGGFGDQGSSAHESADVMLAFISVQRPELLNIEELTTFMVSQQSSLGDWSGSVYQTALVIDALQSSSITNISVTNLAVLDENIYSGEIVKVIATIENNTAINTEPSIIEFSIGDPLSGGSVFETVSFPVIPSFQSLQVTAYLNTSGVVGSRSIFATADLQNLLVETTNLDNQLSLDIEILASPNDPELTIDNSNILITPNQVLTLPKALSVAVDIRNIGLEVATDLQLQLWQGEPDAASSVIVEERNTSIGGQSIRTEIFEIEHSLIGETPYTVVVDSNYRYAEINESDNRATAIVSSIDSVDLSLSTIEADADAQSIFLNQEVEFTTTVKNNGTTAAPATIIEFLVRNVAGESVIQQTSLSLEAGEARQLTASWLANSEGSSIIEVRADFQNLVSEVNEDNNVALIDVAVMLAEGNNLSVNFSDLQFSPNPGLEGMGATLSAVVRNNGTNHIDLAEVHFYDGNPATGGELIGSTSIVNLASTESRVVSVIWGQIPDQNDRFIYAVIDPNSQLIEVRKDDNIAFEKFNVISLPDFAVSDQSIATTPAFPKIEEVTAFAVKITNRGSQRQEDLAVSAYLGSVDSGVVIAVGEVTIEGNSDAVFEFDYTFTEFENTQISIAVDQDELVRESNELNNISSRRFTIQDGDFYVSDLYLSPDGDGIKDQVEYYFNLDSPAVVVVLVTDAQGDTVGELEVSDQATISGSVLWDGKNNFGGLVSDGNYTFSVKDQAGAIQGERTITLDTNRSPLVNAINTPFALERNLSCRIGEIYDPRTQFDKSNSDFQGLVYGPNDQFLYFPTFLEPELDGQGTLITTNENVLFPSGIYQAQNDGSQVIQLVADGAVADADLADSNPIKLRLNQLEGFTVSPDGKTIVAFTHSELNHFWVLDIETAELKKVEHFARFRGLVEDMQFVSDELVIFNSADDGLFTLNTATMALNGIVWFESDPSYVQDAKLSVNTKGTHALMSFNTRQALFRADLPTLFDGTFEFSLSLIDLETNEVSSIATNASGFSWSPTGDRFVVGLPSEGRLSVFSSSGSEIQNIPFAEQQGSGLSQDERQMLANFIDDIADSAIFTDRFDGDFGHFSWSPDGAEFAFVAYDYIATVMLSNGCEIDFNDEFGSLSPETGFDIVANLVGFLISDARAQEGVESNRCFEIPALIQSLFDKYQSLDGIYIAELSSSSVKRLAKANTAVFNGQGSSEFSGVGVESTKNGTNLTVNEFGVPITEDGSVYVSVAGENDFFFLLRNSIFSDSGARAVGNISRRRIEWLTGARELLISNGDPQFIIELQTSSDNASTRESNGVFVLNLDDPSRMSRTVLEQRNIIDGVGETATGKFLNWFSDDIADQCFSNGETRGYRQFQSLLNLTADLRARRADGVGGFLLEGSAVDKNFERYILEFADIDQPGLWTAIAPASSKSVIDDRFTNWVAPYIGRFLIRLTVFDLAGNSRQEIVQVSNVEQASISALFISEQFISPNGDGVKDAAVLNFRVLQSVNLDLRVFNSSDQMVRSIQRSFDVIGSEQAIEWNGRDTSGQIVPDGQYRLKIQNFEFFVTVDNSAPSLIDTTELLFTPPSGNSSQPCRFTQDQPIDDEVADEDLQRCSVQLNRTLEGSVSDLSIKDLVLQQRENSSSIWRDAPRSVVGDSGDTIRGTFSLDELISHKFRLIASDFAGNVAILNIGEKKLGYAHIMEFYDDNPLSGSLNSFGYASQPGFGVRESYRSKSLLDPDTDIRTLRYQHSAANQVQFVELLYLDSSVSDAEFTSISVTPVFQAATESNQAGFDVVFDASQLGEDIASFDVKIRLRLVTGEVIDTDTVTLGRDTAYLNLVPSQPGLPILVPGVLAKIETNIKSAQIDRVVLLLKSTGTRDDSRYTIDSSVTRQIEFINGLGVLETASTTQDFDGQVILDQRQPLFTEAAEVVEQPDGSVSIELVSSFFYENNDLGLIGECDFAYKLTALLYPAGSIVPIEKQTGVIGRCINTKIDVDPVLTPSCTAEPSNSVDIHYFAKGESDQQASSLTPLLLRIGIPDGENELGSVLFSRNLPEFNTVHSFRLNTASYAEGFRELRAVLTLEDGSSVVENFSVPVVHQAPLVDITFPVDGSQICALEYSGNLDSGVYSGVEVQGSIRSVGPQVGFSALLEDISDSPSGNLSSFNLGFSGPPSEFLLQDRIEENIRGPVGDASTPREISIDRLADNKELVLAPIQSLDGGYFTTTQGLLAVPKANFDGLVRFGFNVVDWSGASQCRAIEVEVDGAIDGARVSLENLFLASEPPYTFERVTKQYPFFSPNGDGQLDTAGLTFTVNEAVQLSMEVFETSFDELNGSVVQGERIAFPYSDLSISSGDTQLQWSGQDSGGQVVADGIYLIEITAEDPCGNLFIDSQYVGIDNTAPIAEINYPTGAEDLPIEVRARGNVSDPRGGQYELTASRDGSNITIGTGLISSSGEIGKWNTFGLTGSWILSLKATDGLGNQSTTFETFTIPERLNLISSLDTTEYFISPNSDGRLDSLAIRVAFERAVSATITIKTVNGDLVKSLASDLEYSAGSHTINWDGTSSASSVAEDDVYRVEVRASGFGNIQTESIQFELDNTPPNIELTQLNDGFIELNKQENILGAVSDQNFDRYQIDLTAVDKDENIVSAAFNLTSSNDEIDGVLAVIPDQLLDIEQQYLVTTVVYDLAGNRTRLTPYLVIDKLPPALTLVEPVADAFFNTDKSPITVKGSVSDGFLRDYNLTVAPVNELESTSELGRGVDSIDPFSAPWSITNVADGAYRINLSASDRAGLKASLSHTIVIDSTPPEVAISEPAELVYVTKPIAIIGSANDDYFSQYSITIANGHIDDSSNFNELLTSSLSRNEQRLFVFAELPDDGNYRLKLEASDKAGNGSSVIRQIVIDTTPPTQPTLISAESTDNPEEVLLSWEANTETDLQGYIVFRNGQPISDIIDALEELDSSLLEGQYNYQVLAIDNAGLRSELSDPLSVVIDVTPPLLQILQPRANSTANLLVDIVGTAFSDNDFKEYRVYVGPSGGGLTKIRTSNVPLQGAELAQWDTTLIASEGEYVIRLEAEDTHGNSASIETAVLVDNIAPAAPENLTAEISASDNNDVLVEWEFPSADADLLGFLIFRNGKLANTNEVVLGDLRQFAIDELQFDDQDRPDGNYRYVVYAIDIAGNISAPSNFGEVELDYNAPIAVITSVDDGQGFDQSLYLLAETDDRDVAQVLFQYRRESDPVWIDIDLSQSEPFEYQWDTQALDLGGYELRAVATDFGGRFDQAPSVLSITKRDILAPQKLEGLAISVVGSDGVLSWNASSAGDLAGYNVYRAECVECIADDFELIAEGLSTTSFEESIASDLTYRYKVTALDSTGNESVESDQITGVYGTAKFSLLGPQRFVPQDGLSESSGQAASLVVTNAGFSLPIDEVVVTYVDKNLQTSTQTVTFDQALVQQIVRLEWPSTGVTSLTITARSSRFNTTTRSSVPLSLIVYQVPTVPSGLTAVCAFDRGEQIVNISWNENPTLENVLGYRVFRGGVRIGGDNEFYDPIPEIEDASAFASVGSSPENFLPDSAYSDAWVPGDINGVEFGQTWQSVREVSSIGFDWRSRNHSAADIAIDALIDGEYIEVAQSLDRFSSFVEVTLDRPVPTSSIRVRVLRWNSVSTSSPGSLLLMTVYAYDLAGGTSFTDEDVDFSELDDISEGYDYRVQAVEEYGGVSPLSAPLNVQCDGQNVEPPVGSGDFVIAGQVDGADIVITWEQIEPDLNYRVYLSNEQYTNEYWGDVFAESRIDLGALENGTHRFYVIAINEFDEVVDVSNTVELVVNQPLPMGPANLVAIADNTDQTILLTWQIMDGVSAEEFDVYRSVSEASGFERIANINGDDFDFTDRNVQQGVSYFYRVVMFDQADNETEPSNTASAELEVVVSFSTPIINVPTDQYQAISVTNNVASVGGLAEQGALISLLQNGEFVGDATRATDIVEIIDLTKGLEVEVIDVISDSQGQAVLTTEDYDSGDIQLWAKQGNTLQLLADEMTRSGSISFVAPNLVMLNQGGINDLLVYSLDGATSEPLDLEFPPSRAFIRRVEAVNLASKTYVINAFLFGRGWGDYLYHQETGEFDLLTGSQYSYSPDGKRLAYIRSQSPTIIEVRDLENDEIVDFELATIAGNAGFELVNSWSPDSTKLLLNTTDDVAPLIIDTKASSNSITKVGEQSLHNAVWAGNNRVVTQTRVQGFVTDTELLLFDLVTQTSHAIGRLTGSNDPFSYRPTPTLLGFKPSLESGVFVSAGVDSVLSFSTAGYFNFDNVTLEQGENIFSAIAVSATGDTSVPAENISVSLQSEPMPDYQLELEINPPLLVRDQGAALTLLISNVGNAIAEASSLTLKVFDPSGESEVLLDQLVGPVDIDSSLEIATAWIPSSSGVHTIVAVIDDANLILEQSEANNRRIRNVDVSDNALPTLSVQLERSLADNFVFGPTELVASSITIANPGPSFDGTVVIEVIDQVGGLVDVLDRLSVDDLILGEERSFAVQWNPKLAVLGDYRLHARLIDQVGSEVATSSQALSLREPLSVLLGLRPQKFSFDANQEVRLTATLINNSLKAVVDQGVLILKVFDADDNVIDEQSSRPLNLLIDGRVDQVFTFPTGSNKVGRYRAQVVLLNSQLDVSQPEISRATASFEITLQNSSFTGELVLGDRELSIGQKLTYQSQINNAGNTDIDDLTITYQVEKGIEVVVSEQQNIASLLVAEELSEQREFVTSALPNSRYKLVMLATQTLENGVRLTQRLAEESFAIVENQPPVVAISRPNNDQVVNSQRISALVSAIDESGVISVDGRFNDGPWFSLNTSTFEANRYRVGLSSLEEGAQQFSVRAIDINANSSNALTHNFVVDNTAPTINFVNITDMQQFAEELQPIIDVSDQHLDRVTMLLNGEPYLVGQMISGTGDFTLQVNAFDLADNTQRASVRFTIGQQVPPVVLTAIDDLLELRRGGLGNVKLLDNDVFGDIGDLTVAITKQPSNGRLIRLTTGNYNYYPGLLFIGADSFSYSITDTVSKETSSANVTVAVRPGASCSFVPDHSTSETQPVLLPAWARSAGDNQPPRFRVRLTNVSDVSAFAVGGVPTITFPDCSLSYTAKADTRATVKVMYVVEDVATSGRRYTSPSSTFEISINTKTDNPSVVIPVLKLLLLHEDR